MLDNQAHRAARLITDTGIHALGGRARPRSTRSRKPARSTPTTIEVDRYIGMPGQALCYIIGMVEIERARETAAAAANGDFSLRGFHDRVLATGELPLPSFRRVSGTD